MVCTDNQLSSVVEKISKIFRNNNTFLKKNNNNVNKIKNSI